MNQIAGKAASKNGARGSLSTKIILVQLAVVLIVMGLNGVVTYLQDSRQLNDSLHQRGEQLLKRLPASLSAPLWNVDAASVDSAVSLEMMDSDVQAIVVTAESGASGKMRDAKDAVIAWSDQEGQRIASSAYKHLSADVTYQDKAIGKLDVYLSDRSITEGLKSFLLQTTGVTVVVILLLALATLFITRVLVARPLKIVDGALGRIAHGNLGSTVDFHSRDELGSLAHAVNEMISQLRGMVVKIRETADQLAKSSVQISENSQQLASGSQSQAATLEETSASVEELTSSVEQVALHAQSQADSVEKTSAAMTEVRGSAETVSETLKVVSASSEESVQMAHSGVDAVNNAVTAIEAISQKAEQIGGIVTVISDIADQTNLLSLNAAIEAARAGEHGRGFAVVAQEVSKLAERSAASTREIQTLINESGTIVTNGVKVAQGALSAMNAIIDGAQKTNKAITELSGRIHSQIDSIANAVAITGSITEMSHSISAATEEQTTNARQVATAVENVNELTQHAALAAEQMSAATVELSQLAQQLTNLVQQFALETDSPAALAPSALHSAGTPMLALGGGLGNPPKHPIP